jgi:hypothetical protein
VQARQSYEAMTALTLRELVTARDLPDKQQDRHKLCERRFKAVADAKYLSGADGIPARARVRLGTRAHAIPWPSCLAEIAAVFRPVFGR